ncbi:MAG: SDR family oxidoreductase [Betaproteobacteria bacterium]|nr:SDR family oxidoreductase [Betaproteobacteria bacterium]NBS39730.1 SDR family oxidoreductase [Betaproteobacteria bacterium]NBT06041.1 SDR family oxidoreductase [Betaproteobacteria bacterium]NBT82147.1 SDR family oxidoreductase [Betaproteobacteria bacterium]NCV15295.1 SDR family oxidoreductase [Betaproteobacteria bacterium]
MHKTIALALISLLLLLRASAATDSPARVINIGSIDGIKTSVFDALFCGASKAALHRLTLFMAAHLTPERILFNAIAHCPFPTWMQSIGVGFGGVVSRTTGLAPV